MKKFLLLLIGLMSLYGCDKDPINGPIEEPGIHNWTRHPENPVLVPGSPGEWDQECITPGSVIFHDGLYHMWYAGGIFTDTMRIGHATSQDGITWDKDPANPVLDVGATGTWDENSLVGGYVIRMGSMFHMWYTGHGGQDFNTNYRIGHATSTDGTHWEKDPGNPVINPGQSGSWDDAWISGGHVVFDGSEYHIYYSGFGTGVEHVSCGHATSPDALTWTKDGLNPVLTGQPGSWDFHRVDLPSVVIAGNTFHMWYMAGHWFDWKIGYASSEDGSSWTRYGLKPVFTWGSPGSWDANSVGFCSVMDSSGVKYKMWYSGSNTEETGSIGYAESLTSNSGS